MVELGESHKIWCWWLLWWWWLSLLLLLLLWWGQLSSEDIFFQSNCNSFELLRGRNILPSPHLGVHRFSFAHSSIFGVFRLGRSWLQGRVSMENSFCVWMQLQILENPERAESEEKKLGVYYRNYQDQPEQPTARWILGDGMYGTPGRQRRFRYCSRVVWFGWHFLDLNIGYPKISWLIMTFP